jgi:hypothetical protein
LWSQEPWTSEPGSSAPASPLLKMMCRCERAAAHLPPSFQGWHTPSSSGSSCRRDSLLGQPQSPEREQPQKHISIVGCFHQLGTRTAGAAEPVEDHPLGDTQKQSSPYKWVVFSPSLSLLGESAEGDPRHIQSPWNRQGRVKIRKGLLGPSVPPYSHLAGSGRLFPRSR